MIRKKLNWGGVIHWERRPDRPGEIYYLNSIGSLFSSITGWQPKVNLSEGIDKTIEIWNGT